MHVTIIFVRTRNWKEFTVASTMADVNLQFLISLCVIMLGYGTKRAGLFKEEDGTVFSKIVLYLTLPALIIKTISAIEIDANLALMPLFAIGYGGLMLGISFLVFRHVPRDQKGLLTICCLGFNIGLFAFPFIENVWGPEGLVYIAMFDLGNAFVIFGFAYIVAVVYSPQHEEGVSIKYIAKRFARNIPLLGYITGLLLNIFGVTLPLFVTSVLDILSVANTALVLLLLGIFLKLDFKKQQWASILKILGIRYLVGISCGIILFLFLPFGLLFRATLLLALILPIGMAVIPYSIEFEHDREFAGGVVNITIIISFCLMWLIMALVTPV